MAFLTAVPTKNRRRNPALVSFNKRRLILVVDVKPASILICSRSPTRSSQSIRNKARSRFCKTIEPDLVPIIECLLGCFRKCGLPCGNIGLDLGSEGSPGVAHAIYEVRRVDLRFANKWSLDLLPWVGAAFDNGVTLRQIFQAFGKRLSAIKRLCNLRRIGAR